MHANVWQSADFLRCFRWRLKKLQLCLIARPNMSSFKSCVVKNCPNTSIKCPGKLFFAVPSDPKRRKAWLTASHVDPAQYSIKTHLDVCQDHFKLEEDAENFIEVMICPDRRVRLKKSAVPHIFECQPDRAAAQPQRERPLSAKRARKSLVESLLDSAQSDMLSEHVNQPDQPSTSAQPQEESWEQDQQRTFECSPEVPYSSIPRCSDVSVQVGLGMLAVVHKNTQTPVTATANKSCQVLAQIPTENKSAQTRPQVRSKSTQCDLGQETIVKLTVTGLSPKIPSNSSKNPLHYVQVGDGSSSSPIQLFGKSSSSWSPGAKGSSETDYNFEKGTPETAKVLRRMNVNLCKENPMHYLGIPDDYLIVLESLSKCIQTDETDVIMCLKKIRLDRIFKELGHDFEVSESHARKKFVEVVPQLAQCMEKLIEWPDELLIKERLPIHFRARYSHVQSIIDAFEIQIQKPSDPLLQTLTWSNYKHCNTMKILISCTPDGLINFVSKALGGRISDLKLTEQSGFLDVLPNGVGVMADRGFKGIAKLLDKKNCELIRPPSVQASEKSSKAAVKESKRIASLRIHVERVIRREREFGMLEPHACLNINLIKYLDDIVTIACGLINLQRPLMKKHV